MKEIIKPVGIIGTGFAVPENIISNKDLTRIVDTSDEWISSRTGISERRKIGAANNTSDLCAQAAEMAIVNAGITALDIDLIIVATVTPDMIFPATACIVQEKIGAKNAAAFDLEAACSGFVYGMAVGQQFIATGMYKNVLIIGGETLSRVVDWQDRNTCILFGDGAGAVVLQEVPSGYGILANYLRADGSGADLLKIPAGGAAKPPNEMTITNREHFIKMAGNDIYKFAVKVMGDAAMEVLTRAQLTKEDVDFLVPHQANTRIIEAAVKRLGLSEDKVIINIHKYGNMSSASIPIALHEAFAGGRIKKDDIVVMVGFGGGLTWGSSVLRWFEK
ncbi:MAG: beta-ketoacyl-ACP synthase III [Bacillota bacterium]|nr:beta-ketoacyl-ACP synthase III [Bacillota bacterium]